MFAKTKLLDSFYLCYVEIYNVCGLFLFLNVKLGIIIILEIVFFFWPLEFIVEQ